MSGSQSSRRMSAIVGLVVMIMFASYDVAFAQLQEGGAPGIDQSSDSLPNAPVPSGGPGPNASIEGAYKPPAPRYALIIEPDYRVERLTAIGKVRTAGGELFSVEFPINVILAAGLSHGLDSEPKYGTNSEAFAKRVGAAGARDSSQILFSHAILAPLFHQDPRYYVSGHSHSILARAGYAASRVVIGRVDSGRHTINFSDLAGYGGSAALTQFYYPANSRDRDTMFKTYGYSLVGLALHNEIWEFFRVLNRGQRP